MFSSGSYGTNEQGGPIGDYQNPFHDLATATMPDNLKEFFEDAMGIYYRYEVVRLAVDKLSEYAITNFIYSAGGKNSEAIESSYKQAFEQKLRIKPLLIRVGKEYYIVGNSFLTFNFGVKRRLLCPYCHVPQRKNIEQEVDSSGKLSPLGIDIVNMADIKYTSGEFKGTCPECKRDNVTFHVEDDYPQNLDNVIIKTWPIKYIDVLPNRWNDKEVIIWQPPEDMVKSVKDGNMKIIRELPLDVLKSIEKEDSIELDNVFHFKMVGPADEFDELGKGLVLCAYKTIFHTAILRKASEAVALEHIVPLRVIFPEGVGGVPPQSMLMTQFKTFIEEEFVLWRTDPNHVIISPMPIGQEYLGGQGRAFLPTPEIRASNEDVFMGFGLPMTLFDGNATFASNSISMRIIENHFLTYRDQLQEVMDWIQSRCENYLSMEHCDCSMQEFKMLDDIEHKSQMINLALNRKIPMKEIYKMFDMDYTEVTKQLEKEILDEAEIQAKASGVMMTVQTKQQQEMEADFQARQVEASIQSSQQMMESNVAMITKLMQTQPGLTLDQAVMINQQINQAQQMQQQAMMQQQQAEQAKMLFMMDRMGKAQWSNVRAQREGSLYDMMGSMNQQQTAQETNRLTSDSIQQYLMLPPHQQKEYLNAVYQKGPVYYETFVNQLQAMGEPPPPHPMAGAQQ